jgi:hypothetical protein
VLNGRLHVLVEYRLSNPEGLLVVPETGVARCAVLVLSGSSGRVEVDRVRLLADRGAVALSIRWFGDAGQPPGICEVRMSRSSLIFGGGHDRQAAITGSS